MISPSLKNLRTTLWSMLQKTKFTSTRRRINASHYVAALAGGMFLVGSSLATAQQSTGRGVLQDAESALPPESFSGSFNDENSVDVFVNGADTGPINVRAAATTWKRSTDASPVSNPLQTQVPTAAATHTNVLPAAPDETTGPISASDPCSIGTWEQDYACRVDHVLGRSECRSHSSLADWWHGQSMMFRSQNRGFAIHPDQLKAAARVYIDNHTLPPEQDFAVDVYDQRPIVVASTHTYVQPESKSPGTPKTGASVEEEQPGTNRLKTDVRTIRPSLSYAMRNIEASQLPDGFHEKLDQGEYVARQPSPAVLQWAPSNLYHYPLYFEDPALERYGHTYHPVVQPFASAGRFATQLVGLPYQMTLHPVHSREYALGYYRPGECAPKKHYQIPFNEEAAVAQAAAMAGFFLIFP